MPSVSHSQFSRVGAAADPDSPHASSDTGLGGKGGEASDMVARLRALGGRITDLAASKGPPFVPHSFDVPKEFIDGLFSLRLLSSSDLNSYHGAVTAVELRPVLGRSEVSGAHMESAKESSLVDLRRYEKEHALRLAFAFIVTSSSSECVGSVHIFPATKLGFDAEVLLWGKTHGLSQQEATELDTSLEHAVRRWLSTAWPFRSIAYPGRPQSWSEMDKLPWRSEPVPRIGLDAQTVFMYHARSHGLALQQPYTSVPR
jgi:hypothetical protein